MTPTKRIYPCWGCGRSALDVCLGPHDMAVVLREMKKQENYYDPSAPMPPRERHAEAATLAAIQVFAQAISEALQPPSGGVEGKEGEQST